MTEKDSIMPRDEIETRLPVPQSLSENSPLLEEEEPFHDRLWYVRENHEHLLPIPEEFEDADFHVIYFLAEIPGENIYYSDLKSNIEINHGIGSARLQARIGRIRRWLGDNFENPSIIQEHIIDGKKAYSFNADKARMLVEGEAVPSWPEETEDTGPIPMVPGQAYPLAPESKEVTQQETRREHDRIQYSYTKRYIKKKIIDTIPEELDEGDLQVLPLLSTGIRLDSQVPAILINRELDEILPGGNKVQLNERIRRLKMAFPNLARFILPEGNGYRLALDEFRLLHPEPEPAEETEALTGITTIPEFVEGSTVEAGISPLPVPAESQNIFKKRYPLLYSGIPAMVKGTIKSLGGTEATAQQLREIFGLDPSYSTTNIGKLVHRDRTSHGPQFRYSVTDVLMLRLNREVHTFSGRDLDSSEISALRKEINRHVRKRDKKSKK